MQFVARNAQCNMIACRFACWFYFRVNGILRCSLRGSANRDVRSSYRSRRNAFLFPVGDSWDETKRNFAGFHTSEMFRRVCARCTLRGRNPKPPIDSPARPDALFSFQRDSNYRWNRETVASSSSLHRTFVRCWSEPYDGIVLRCSSVPQIKSGILIRQNSVRKNLIRLLSLILCTDFFYQIYLNKFNQL